jgi:hypothetical protein
MTWMKSGVPSEAAPNLLALETGLPRLSSHPLTEPFPVARDGYDDDDCDSAWVDLGGEG